MLNSERQAHIKAALSTAAEPLSASSLHADLRSVAKRSSGILHYYGHKANPLSPPQEAIRYRNQLHLSFWFHVSIPRPNRAGASIDS